MEENEQCMMNSTPGNDFVNTRKALTDLIESLKCQHCHNDTVDIYHLGNCDHCFCRSCAEPKIGKSCPICYMLPDASKAKVDLQLSNIASLCRQMFQLFDDDMINATAINNGSAGCSKTEKNPEYTKTVSLPDNSEMYTTCSKTPRQESSFRNSSDSLNIDKTREGEGKISNNVTACLQLQQDQENTPKRRRQKNTKESAIPNQSQRGIRGQVSMVSELGTHQEKEKNESNKSVETKRRGRPLKQSSSLTPKRQTENTTPRTQQANLSKRNAKGETQLQVATIKADLETVKKLLQAGANPNVKDNAGWTPLHEAVNHGNVDIADMLIAHGASVNAPGLENDTPLHDAVSNYRCDCVRLLVSKGANVYLRNSHGQTPMDIAQTEEMKQLLFSSSFNADDVETNDQSLYEETNRTICLLASMLTKDEQHIVRKFQKLFQCKNVDQFSPEVTHLITGTDAEGIPTRTMKYLSSITCGKWIVSPEWLQASIREKSIVPEKAFLVPGSRTRPDAPLKAVENRLKQLPKLFDGCQFYLYSKFPFSTLQRDQIAELIKLGGGVTLSREPRLHNLDDYPYTRPYHAQDSNSLADCTIYKIYDNACSDPPSVQSQRMSCLPLSWLVDSISAFSLQEKNGYVHNSCQ